MTPDCTLTTANFYFNDSTRKIEDCLENMKLLLSIPCYLVIFCNKILYPSIKAIRDSFGFLDRTYYIVQEFSEIWTYQYYNQVKDNREKYWPTRDPRTGVESHLITCNKFDFVLQSITLNPFNTSKFGWIDSNLGKNGIKISEEFNPEYLIDILKNINDNFRIQIMGVEDKKYKLIENKKEYYEQYRWVVCGCLFTLSSSKIKILERLKELFITSTNCGVGHGEEMLYLEILDEYYDEIDRAYGDYRQILHNFIKPVRNYNYIFYNIVQKYLNLNYHKECYDCCSKIIKVIESGKYEIDYELYVKFLFSQFVASYYHKNKESRSIANKILNLSHENNNFSQEFNKAKHFYLSQLKHSLNYKYIFLIIDSDNLPYYEYNRNIIKKYHNNDEIKSIFIRFDKSINDIKIKNDTMYIPGNESYIPGILEKTLIAMHYCYDNFNFDYIVRTNLSSFWNYKLLKEQNFDKKNYIGALIGEHNGIKFPAGSGFILSKDMVELCIKNKDKFDYSLPDDVSFGKFFYENDKIIKANPRYDFLTNLNEINEEDIKSILEKKHFHYRVMGSYGMNRNYDKFIFELLYKYIYE